MHELYAADRKRYYSRATLNEMLTKRIDFLSPAVLLEVFLDTTRGTVYARLEPALEALYHQLKHNKGHIRLEIDHCKILQRIQILVLYDIMSWVPNETPRIRCRNLPGLDHEIYWDTNKRFYPVHQILYLGVDRKATIEAERLKEQVELDFEMIMEEALWFLEDI